MKKQKIKIREYRSGDAEALANIYYNTIHKVNIQHYTLEQVNVWAPETSLDGNRWIKKFEKTKPFIAIADDLIVGFAEFEPDGHIDCFYCHHNWIGCGVGSALMSAIHEKATNWKIKHIFAEVSITAKPFFEKQGFTVTKEQTVIKNGVQFINYRMEKTLEMKPSYLNLCTEFYDLTKPEAGPKEIAFYESLMRSSKGPILEAMCGSGRLLIPLLKKGFVVEGVDNSFHMLESCRKRCEEQHLHAELYNQPLEALSLPKKYDLIFIAIGSFQLIHDEAEAQKALKSLAAALLPGGRLVLETFIPWDAIKDNIDGGILADQSKEITAERVASYPDGIEIINQSTTIFYFNKQLEISQANYQKRDNGKLLHAEEEEYAVRWYHRNELKLFLEKAGFSSVEIVDASFEQNEQAVIYIAQSRKR